ncbi:DNA-binding protein [uncultured Variovorax sp.]|mgnify:CR=1 FL=1|uniref:DNA-binding protein n=1 Tax=uncultured Variovorax sp. TaxID=114708 RepID=UPI00262D328F|nr:DNA-binding protein [uncultured Variovorax sp.]
MRPAEFSVEAIIQAGQALQAAGRNVTGFALRQKVGGGNPSRLRQVWDEHLAQAQSVVELPVEVAEALAQVTASLAEQVSKLVTGLYARAEEVASRRVAEARQKASAEVEEAVNEVDRVESECNAAKAEAGVLTAKLAEVNSLAQAQAIELAQLRERSTAFAAELAQVREEFSLARNQALEAREEAARLRGQLDAIGDQRDELVRVLAGRSAAAESGVSKSERAATGKVAK